jgi:serine/threonine protein kinase
MECASPETAAANRPYKEATMSEPRPPASPPTATDATGEWSAVTARESRPAESPTLTGLGFGSSAGENRTLPNPFGRYAIVRLLGRGGMGAVYLAQDTQLDRPVALKIPRFRGIVTGEQKERFFREARAVAALRHPNICPVYDVDDEQGTLYLTTAFIDGHTLATVLKDGPLDALKAARLIRQVALAMQAAHEHGTIHRDLKPANIMIDAAGEPVVMDFGLARKGEIDNDIVGETEPAVPQPRDAGLTQMGSVLGTPAYMPPEQAIGDLNAIGPRSDVYALGAVLYECLTGRRPFDGPDTGSIIKKILHVPPARPREFVNGLDAGLEDACLKAMAKDPADRFQSMAEFAAVLHHVIDPKLEVVPPPLPSGRNAKRPAQRRRWFSPFTCLLLTLSLLALCVVGPATAIWILIDRVTDKVKELQKMSERSNAEWEAISAFWQPPPANADLQVLFPATLPNGYRRTKNDTEVADAELGLTLAGQRAVYTASGGEEVEVRVYRCPESEAKAIQAKVQAYVKSLQTGSTAFRGDSKRQKVVYTNDHSGFRTVTFGFSDTFNGNQEYGKIWYGGGWLYYFKTAAPLIIESFPAKFLIEVGRLANVPKKEVKKGK